MAHDFTYYRNLNRNITGCNIVIGVPVHHSNDYTTYIRIMLSFFKRIKGIATYSAKNLFYIKIAYKTSFLLYIRYFFHRISDYQFTRWNCNVNFSFFMVYKFIKNIYRKFSHSFFINFYCSKRRKMVA